MTRLTRGFDTLSMALITGMAAITAGLYDRLPERVPTHWGLDGEVNGTMGRAYGAWAALVLAFGLWALLRSSPLWIGERFGERIKRSPMDAVAFLTVALMCGVQCLILWASLHPGQSAARAILLGLGVYALLLAQLLPRMRRNPLVGIRNAWTLSSDENWHRTHRFAAYTVAAGGLVAIACGLVGAGYSLGVAALLLALLAPYPYSFLADRKG